MSYLILLWVAKQYSPRKVYGRTEKGKASNHMGNSEHCAHVRYPVNNSIIPVSNSRGLSVGVMWEKPQVMFESHLSHFLAEDLGQVSLNLCFFICKMGVIMT